MKCPECEGKTVVRDNVNNPESNENYRKRKCTECGYEFCTIEFEIDVTEQVKNDWKKYHRIHANIFPRKYNRHKDEC